MVPLLIALRPVNLLILSLTQFIIWYLIFVPLEALVHCRLGVQEFSALMFSTICLTASGYLINDHFDVKADRINRPRRSKGSHRFYIHVYYFIFLMGVIPAIYLNLRWGTPVCVLVYMLIASMLFLYSASFQGLPLLGNIIVSFLTACTVWLFIWIEWPSINNDDVPLHTSDFIVHTLMYFGWFAFFISMYRELVKDAEDVPGDSLAGLRTIPVIANLAVTRIAGLCYLAALSVVIGMWYSGMPEKVPVLSAWVYAGLLGVPLIAMMVFTARMSTPRSFGYGSLMAKIFMLCGLIFLILQLCFYQDTI